MAHLWRYLCLRRSVCTRIAMAREVPGGPRRADQCSRLSQEAQVDETLQKAGVNVVELKRTLAAHGAQIDAILARSNSEAHALGMHGTPGLLVGRDVSSDIGDLTALQTAVAEARQSR